MTSAIPALRAHDAPRPVRGAAPPAGADHPDARLLARLRGGDDAAFTELVRRETPRLLAVARRILRSDEEAHDALQEAWCSAFQALRRFDGRARLSTWLHRIVVNAALMRLRAQRRRREEPIEPLLPEFTEDGHRRDPGPAWTLSAEEQTSSAELAAHVRAAIDRLPERLRSVLVLRDMEGLETAEAAAALGIRVGAAKMRLHRARQALRALLDPHLAPR